MVFSIIMVELTLIWNHVTAVIGPHGNVAYPSQLLPMLIGTLSLVRILFLIVWEKADPDDKEEGETATAPPSTNPLAHAPPQHGLGFGQGLESLGPQVASPESAHSEPQLRVGPDDGVPRSTLHRYLVAWLPWLSQFPFWTRPSAHHARNAGGKDWRADLGEVNARDSGMAFLHDSLQSPTSTTFGSPRPEPHASSTITSADSPMIRFDEKV